MKTVIMRPILIAVLALVLLNSQTTLAGNVVLVGEAACYFRPDHNSPLNVTGTIKIRDYKLQGVLNINRFLEVSLNVSGLDTHPGNDTHGLYVHECGDITKGCGSTRGHYNPLGQNHAGLTVPRHIGDLGNVKQDANGNIKDTYWFPNSASLVGEHSIIGRAFVLHAGKDDLGRAGDSGSKASGNAGPRLGCCVIGWAKPGGDSRA